MFIELDNQLKGLRKSAEISSATVSSELPNLVISEKCCTHGAVGYDLSFTVELETLR